MLVFSLFCILYLVKADLIHYYPLNGDWMDYSGNGNDAFFISNPNWGLDRCSQPSSSLAPLDQTSVLHVENAFDGFNTPFTVSLWFLIHSTCLSSDRSIIHFDDTGMGYPDLRAIFFNPNTRKLYFEDYNTQPVNASEFLNDNTWYNIVFTLDNVGNLEVYVNSLLTLSLSGISTMKAVGVSYGGAYYTGNRELDGRIDDVRYYNEILSQSDINMISSDGPLWNPKPKDQSVLCGEKLNFTITAVDTCDNVVYSFGDVPPPSEFNIDENSGRITSSFNFGPSHMFNLMVNVTSGGITIMHQFLAVTQEVNPPYWNTIPEDQVVECGEFLYYNLSASSDCVLNYFVNDTTNFYLDSNRLTSYNTLVVNKVHFVEITASDGVNSISEVIMVSVEDNTYPLWDNTPENQFVECGSNLSYSVSATDECSSVSYSVNDTKNFQVDNTGLLTSLNVLNSGDIHMIEVFADDGINSISQIISVNERDTGNPQWDSLPENQIVECGSSLSYPVSASDICSVVSYFVNDTTNFNVDSNGLITSLNNFNIDDVYYLEISADDGVNVISKVIMISTTDTIPPTWLTSPNDQLVECESSVSFSVLADDACGVLYSVNDTTNFNVDENGLVTSVFPIRLSKVYFVEVFADDGTNSISEVVMVSATDTKSPTWSPTPENQLVECGSSLDYIVVATDNCSTVSYSVNNTLFNIDNNGLITSSFQFTPNDVYFIEISADDGTNENTEVIMVSTEDSYIPVWESNLENQIVECGTSLSYSVTALDACIIFYSVNDTLNFYVDNNGLLTSLGNLVLNQVHFVKITASDGVNSISEVIMVSVDDTVSPSWDNTPENQFVECGSNLSYSISATDECSSVSFSVNDTINFQVDNTGLLTSLNVLSSGDIHMIEVFADDGINSISQIISVNERDTGNPQWDSLPENQIVECGSSLSYPVSASDICSVVSYFVNDTTNFNADSNGLITSLNNLGYNDVYYLEISADDGVNVIFQTITITTVDTVSLSWVTEPSDQNIVCNEDFEYSISATDTCGDVVYSVDDETNFNIITYSTNGLLTINGDLENQDYTIRITASDGTFDISTNIVISMPNCASENQGTVVAAIVVPVVVVIFLLVFVVLIVVFIFLYLWMKKRRGEKKKDDNEVELEEITQIIEKKEEKQEEKETKDGEEKSLFEKETIQPIDSSSDSDSSSEEEKSDGSDGSDESDESDDD